MEAVAVGERFDQLKRRLADISNLNRALAVLSWDQETYMPSGGAPARAEQLTTLGRMAHELFIADATGELLAGAAEEVKGLPAESDEASLVRVGRKDYDDYRKIPTDLLGEMIHHSALAYGVWVRAKEASNFGLFAPYLEKTIDLSRRFADCRGYEDQRYDALLDVFEPGMKTAQVQAMFATVREELVPLVHAIADRVDRVDDSVLRQHFDESKQEQFGVMVATSFGFDFSRGRQDRTVHPFATSFSRNDVRITTAFDAGYLSAALFSTMHETGHGMYEQGIGESLEGTLLAQGVSFGFHESQSRLWENIVGRGRPFWRHFYPRLQESFQAQLGNTDVESFYRSINRVEPSLIRIEADEVTYNLHIMLRLEMELALLSGELSVPDAPAAWNDKMEDYLGLRPPSDALGILQDVHWSHGTLGYFPTYSLGNFLSVQLYDAAVREHPAIPGEIGDGCFDTLRGWMADSIYRHGRKIEPVELIRRATGESIQSHSYMKYLQDKFGEIYDL